MTLTPTKAMVALWIGAACIVALSSCAGDAQTKATSSLAIGCETMATALEQLAPRRANNTLSADAVLKVNQAKRVTDTVCLPTSPFDPATAASIVQNAIAIVKGI